MRFNSVRVALTSAVLGILALLIVISGLAIASLETVNGSLQAVDDTWLSGMALLGTTG